MCDHEGLGANRPAPGGIPVAVIGLGCRFPAGIHGPERLWDLLVSGRDVIGRVPRGRWDFEKARSTDDIATIWKPLHGSSFGLVSAYSQAANK